MNGEGRVLKHLKEHGAITSWDAISLFGITLVPQSYSGYGTRGTKSKRKTRPGRTDTANPSLTRSTL